MFLPNLVIIEQSIQKLEDASVLGQTTFFLKVLYISENYTKLYCLGESKEYWAFFSQFTCF